MATYTLTFNGSETSNTDGTSSFFNNTKSQIEKLSYHKEIYAPCRIDARLKITDASSYSTMEQVRTSLVGSSVKLASEYEIASNYYVHDVIIEMKKENGNSIYYLNLTIYSKDKLLDIVEECHSYVGQHLCKDILAKGVSRYTDGTDFTIETNADAKNLQFIGYKGKDASGTDAYKELIQPYTVQYNETFYSMLARTANRCGEFMYFEDGKLNVGLKTETNSLPSYLSVTRPTISVKSIFEDVVLFARNYMLDKSSIAVSKDNANSLIKGIIEELKNESYKDLDGKTDFEKAAETIISKKEEYVKARKGVDQYERMTSLIMQMDIKLDQDPYKDIDVSNYLQESDYDNSSKCSEASTNITADITTKSDELKAYEDENLWDEKKEDRYQELRKKKKKERTPEEQKEYEELGDLRENQEAVNNEIEIKKGEIDDLKEINTKIDLYEQRAKYIETRNNDDKNRQWNSKSYTAVKDLDNDWLTYLKGNSDLTNALGKLNSAVGALDEDMQEPLKTYIDSLLQLLSSDFGLENAFSKDGSDSEQTFIYDYSVPVDEYHLDYVDGEYDTRESGGYTTEVEGQALGLKFLNTAVPILEAALKTTAACVLKVVDMNNNQSSANNVMDAAMGIDDMKPYGASDDEYKDGKTHRLYSSLDNKDQAAVFTNINNASFATIRNCEEKLKDQRLIINVNTTTNKTKVSLGKQITYNDASYIITKITGEYKGSTPTETIEAVQVMQIAGTSYYIPPMIQAGHVRYAEPQTAKVVYNMDPKDLMRVRVRYGWQKEDTIDGGKTPSPFIRVATPFAGVGGGIHFQLAKGEEVMIDYDHGNVERPYVSCSLYNGTVKAAAGGNRIIRSQNGHKLVLTDDSDKAWVSVITNNPWFINDCVGENLPDVDKDELAGGISISDDLGFYKIEASSHQRKIALSSPLGSISISAFTGVNINAPYGDITFYGKNVTFNARNKIAMKAGIAIPDSLFGIQKAYKWAEAGFAAINDLVDLSFIRFALERIIEPAAGDICQAAWNEVTHAEKILVGQDWLTWAANMVGIASDTKSDEAHYFSSKFYENKRAYGNMILRDKNAGNRPENRNGTALIPEQNQENYNIAENNGE